MLTRDASLTIVERIGRDPRFAKGVLSEAITGYLKVEVEARAKKAA